LWVKGPLFKRNLFTLNRRRIFCRGRAKDEIQILIFFRSEMDSSGSEYLLPETHLLPLQGERDTSGNYKPKKSLLLAKERGVTLTRLKLGINRRQLKGLCITLSSPAKE
jgi:hypothetical protein